MKTYIILYVTSLGYSSEKWKPLELELDFSPYTREGMLNVKILCAADAFKDFPYFEKKPSDVVISAITEVEKE